MGCYKQIWQYGRLVCIDLALNVVMMSPQTIHVKNINGVIVDHYRHTSACR